MDKETLEARIEELEHRKKIQGLRDPAKVELENTHLMIRVKESEEKRELEEVIKRAKEQGDGDLFEHPKKKKSKEDEFYDEHFPLKRNEY